MKIWDDHLVLGAWTERGEREILTQKESESPSNTD